MIKEYTVIAIDRVEQEAVRACMTFAKKQNANVKGLLLVNNTYKNSKAYHENPSSELFKEYIFDFNDTELLKKILKENSFGQQIFHFRMEGAIKDCQKVIPHLTTPYLPTNEALRNTSEKYYMRKTISEKYPEVCPKFVQLDSPDIKGSAVDSLEFPVIVKPNALHSSFLVTKCRSMDELKSVLVETFKEIEEVYKREHSNGKPSVLVEEFIEGVMYSMDVYVDDRGRITYLPLVKVVTSAEVGRDGYYAYRTIIPTGVVGEDVQAAEQCVAKAIDGTGLTNSVAHVELYKTKTGWKLIELGPRIGGHRYLLYREANGIDHYYNDLLIHAGLWPVVQQQWQRHAAGFTMYADEEGRIESIEGFNDASKVDSVVWLQMNVERGSESIFASNGGRVMAEGVMSNADRDKLEMDVQSVRNLLKFNITK